MFGAVHVLSIPLSEKPTEGDNFLRDEIEKGVGDELFGNSTTLDISLV